MAEHQSTFHLSSMCRVLQVQRSGYYAWRNCPQSHRQQADTALLVHIKQSFEDSHGIYGSPLWSKAGGTADASSQSTLSAWLQATTIQSWQACQYSTEPAATLVYL
jgi:hypothetical protein